MTTTTTLINPDAMAAVADAAYPGAGGRPADHVLIDGTDYIATDKRLLKMYRADFHDAWARYLPDDTRPPSSPPGAATSATATTNGKVCLLYTSPSPRDS